VVPTFSLRQISKNIHKITLYLTVLSNTFLHTLPKILFLENTSRSVLMKILYKHFYSYFYTAMLISTSLGHTSACGGGGGSKPPVCYFYMHVKYFGKGPLT
jgi:hypothetical protein